MQNYAGKLTCTGKHYCDIYMMIYYVCNPSSRAFWLCINYNTKETYIL